MFENTTQFPSAYIDVFPANRRNTAESRNMSEYRFANVTNSIIDTDSFVVSKTFSNNPTDTSYFEFSIHGYHFRVRADALLALANELVQGKNVTQYICAYIDVVTYPQTPSENIITPETFSELFGQNHDDSTGEYNGLTLTNSPTMDVLNQGELIDVEEITANRYYLYILQGTTGNFHIPPSSLIKFTTESLNFSVDGGDISVDV